MLLLILLLALGTLLHQSLEQGTEPTMSVLSRATQKEIIDKINYLRRNVKPTASNMLKMAWNHDASKTAKKWAMKCNINPSPLKERTVNGIYCGESISESNFVRSWSDIIDQWYESGSNFKYGVGVVDPNIIVYGYTQIVWYKSHQMGCALAYCPGSTHPFLYVCHYCPVGNIIQKIATPYKKGPPCGDCPTNCEDKLCTNPCYEEDIARDCKELIDHLSCENQSVEKKCKASCTCKTEII